MKKYALIIMVSLVLLAGILYFVPLPEQIEFRSTCVEVDRQGNILSDEGNLVFEGTYYHYLFQRDTFQLTHLEIPGTEVVSISEYTNGLPPILESPRGYDFIWSACSFMTPSTGYGPEKTTVRYASFFTHPGFPCLAFEYNEDNVNRYFVSTNRGAPTPPEMLKEFCLYLEESAN